MTPTLNLDQDTSGRLQKALADPSVNPNEAYAQAQQYQQSKGSPSNQTQLLNDLSGSQPQSLGDSIGGWVKNNGSTIGSIAGGLAGAALAPETGGLSLALPALLSAGGATAGNVASQLANNEDIGSSDSIKSDLGQAALGGLSEFGGKIIGNAIGKTGEFASGLLTSKSEGLGIASLGLKQGAVDSAGSVMKERVPDFLKRTGQMSVDPEQFMANTKGMQSIYDKIARESGATVKVGDIDQALTKNISSIENGVSSQSVNTAEAIRNEYDFALKRMGVDPNDARAEVDLGKLADAKSLYQGQVNFNSTAHEETLNGVLANTFMDATNKGATDAGLTTADGNSLEKLGQDLRKQYILQKPISKSLFSSPSVAKPINTGGVIRALGGGGAAGFLAGGPAGAAIGSVAEPLIEAAVNSPQSLKFLSGAANAAAPVVKNVSQAIAKSPLTPVVGKAALMGTGNAVSSASSPAPLPQSLSQPTSNSQGSLPTSPSLSGDPLTDGLQAIHSGQPLTQSQYQALIEKDLSTTGGRYSDKITAAYQAGNPAGVQGLGVAANAANTLESLYNDAGGAKGAIGGTIESALGHTTLTAQSVQSYNQQKNALGQEIISQVYGGAGTAADRDQILNLIPSVSDSHQVASTKMATLRSLIQQRLSSMTGSTPGSVSALNSPSLRGSRP